MTAFRIIAAALGLAALTACAAQEQDPAPRTAAPTADCSRQGGAEAECPERDEAASDPWEDANRSVFGVNEAVDDYLLDPAASGYRAVVPRFGRERVSNLLANANAPVLLVNDVLQANGRGAMETLWRFLLNSTAGVGGLFDVAAELGIPEHSTDFGLTLATWGVEPGPYVVLPLLGPSTVRDAAGRIVDAAASPLTWVLPAHDLSWVGWTRDGVEAVSMRDAYDGVIDEIEKSSLDPYTTYRSMYLQHREKKAADASRD